MMLLHAESGAQERGVVRIWRSGGTQIIIFLSSRIAIDHD
jgi:hypothetical protein